jgi:hypothetical protein
MSRRQGSGRRIALRGILLASVGILAACAPPFRAPVPLRLPPDSPRGEAEAMGLVIRATVLADEEAQLELFRANLILAGLLPLHLEMENRGDTPIEVHRARIEAWDERGERLLVRTPRQALRQLFEYYEVTAYRIASRQDLERAFANIAFAFTPALAPGETRRGMLFLALPEEPGPRQPPERLTLTITARRHGHPMRSPDRVGTPRTRSSETFALTLRIARP